LTKGSKHSDFSLVYSKHLSKTFLIISAKKT